MELKPIAHPTFEVTIPSTQQKVLARPIVTRERKMLLTALESDDQAIINQAVKQILELCVKSDNVADFTTFDVEWIFLQLIINSVKESMDLEVRIPEREDECEECGKYRRLKVNLREAKVEGVLSNKKDFLIDVANGVGIKVKYPSEKDLMALDETSEGKTYVEKMTDLISLCVDSVFDESGTSKFSDFDYKTRIDFLDSLPIPVTDKLEEFVKNIPKLSLTVTVECPKCKFKAYHTMTGLSDFFV